MSYLYILINAETGEVDFQLSGNATTQDLRPSAPEPSAATITDVAVPFKGLPMRSDVDTGAWFVDCVKDAYKPSPTVRPEIGRADAGPNKEKDDRCIPWIDSPNRNHCRGGICVSHEVRGLPPTLLPHNCSGG